MQLSAAFFLPQQKSFTFRDRLSSWCTAVWLRIWYDFDELKMVFIIFWDWSKMFGSVKSLWEYILFPFQEIHSHLLLFILIISIIKTDSQQKLLVLRTQYSLSFYPNSPGIVALIKWSISVNYFLMENSRLLHFTVGYNFRNLTRPVNNKLKSIRNCEYNKPPPVFTRRLFAHQWCI